MIRYIHFSATFALFAAALSGCASTGATFRSGVGDSYPEHSPYYAGAPLDAIARDTGEIGHLPIVFQRGASQSAIFDPRVESGSAVDELVRDMNHYLDAIGVSNRLTNSERASKIAAPSNAVPPDVRFGCIPENLVSTADCADRNEAAVGRGRQQMLLAVGRPSAEWIAWNRELTTATATQRTLVVTLEVGQFLMRQEGILGKKVLELGTGNRAQLPWLSALDTPVSVMQLTASLVDPDGKVVRIGAEAFYPRRTRLLVSAVGGQELITDDDVKAMQSYRREDLPGQPIAWQVAMRELVGRVTGRGANDVATSQREFQ